MWIPVCRARHPGTGSATRWRERLLAAVAVSLAGMIGAACAGREFTAGAATPAPATAQSQPPEALYAAPTRVDRAGRVLAAVTINGHGPFRFILDTGANSSALAPRLVEALGLPNDPGAMVRVNGVTGSAMLPVVEIDTLRAGDIELRDVRLPMLAEHIFAGADGILGVEGLQAARIDVDFARDRVTITQSSRARAPGGSLTVPVRLERNGLLIASGRVGRVPVQVIIDTGAERTLGNAPLRDAIEHRVSHWNRRDASVIGVTDDVSTGTTFLAPDISIGNARLRNLPVTFDDLHVFDVWGLAGEPALLVGMDLLGTLQEFVVDYPRRELQLKAYPDPTTQRVRRCGPNECQSRIPPSGP